MEYFLFIILVIAFQIKECSFSWRSLKAATSTNLFKTLENIFRYPAIPPILFGSSECFVQKVLCNIGHHRYDLVTIGQLLLIDCGTYRAGYAGRIHRCSFVGLIEILWDDNRIPPLYRTTPTSACFLSVVCHGYLNLNYIFLI